MHTQAPLLPLTMCTVSPFAAHHTATRADTITTSRNAAGSGCRIDIRAGRGCLIAPPHEAQPLSR